VQFERGLADVVLAELAVRHRCLPEPVRSFQLDVQALAPDHGIEAIERPPRPHPVESNQLDPLGRARLGLDAVAIRRECDGR
jgi:hypothetical protein